MGVQAVHEVPSDFVIEQVVSTLLLIDPFMCRRLQRSGRKTDEE